MTDLVARLRLHRSWRDSYGELNDAPNEAADRIETLGMRNVSAGRGMMEPDEFDDLDDCGNCGGEGYVADCFDGFCINAEDGCALCMRRCEFCNPLPRSTRTTEAMSDG